MNTDSNDTIYDKFLYIIDIAIEKGDVNILKQAISDYKSKISYTYIKMAEKMYQEMIIEKIDDLNI
tara:strand:+ start:1713 stop:1910 length:198 start_codon:yes stop_codon:yes gene_type:complete